MSITEFIQMGGYAGFVWSAYLIAIVVLVVNLWLPNRRHRQQLMTLIKNNQQANLKKDDPPA